jgi:alginate O-acetyltransferase complex protein AlgI
VIYTAQERRYTRPRRLLFFDFAFLFGLLPVSLAAYYLAPAKARNAVFLGASAIFYAGSSFEFLPILVFSILVDYVAGGAIASTERTAFRRGWLVLSLVTNLSLLGYFKYAGLLTETLRNEFGFQSVSVVHAVLPVGISFFTFQSMSYSIDIYRERIKPARSFIDFATYVSMFPQLIAGPIIRFTEVSDALIQRTHSLDMCIRGAQRFCLGLGKKLLLADTAAALAQPIFSANDPSLPEAWVAMILFSWQIYFDFSGYSDMAIGLGRMFGFEFPENFDSPYRSRSFSMFWRRWHMTLSTWLRDNLYVPLGGNRRSTARTYLNLCATMVLGGFWHGASWNFVIWGGLHGSYLIGERILGWHRADLGVPPIFRAAFVYILTVLAWVFFRVEGFHDALRWVSRMFTGSMQANFPIELWLSLPLFAFAVWAMPNSRSLDLRIGTKHTPILGGLMMFSLWVAYGRGHSPFLYFRF